MRIFTIGYEGATMGEFIAALKQAGGGQVIDVRAVASFAASRIFEDSAPKLARRAGIDYVHLRALGTPADGRAAARAGRHRGLARIYAGQLELPEAIARGRADDRRCRRKAERVALLRARTRAAATAPCC